MSKVGWLDQINFVIGTDANEIRKAYNEYYGVEDWWGYEEKVTVPTEVGTARNIHDFSHNPIPQGWECPKCGRVYSPFQQVCLYCPDELRETVSTSEYVLNPDVESTETEEIKETI